MGASLVHGLFFFYFLLLLFGCFIFSPQLTVKSSLKAIDDDKTPLSAADDAPA